MAIDPTDLPDYRTPAELRRDLATSVRTKLRAARSAVDTPGKLLWVVGVLTVAGAVLLGVGALVDLAGQHHGSFAGEAPHLVLVAGAGIVATRPVAALWTRFPALRALVVAPGVFLVAAAVPGLSLAWCLASGAAAGVLGVVLLGQHRSLRPELLAHPSEVVSTAVEPGAAEHR